MKRVAFLQELQMAAESVPVCALLVSGRRITSTFCTRLCLPMANCLRLNNERKRQLTSLVFVHHCRIWSVRKLSRTPPLDLGDICGSVNSKLCQRSACKHATHVQLTHRNNSSHVPQGFTKDFTKLVGRKQRRISFSPSDRSLALLLWIVRSPLSFIWYPSVCFLSVLRSVLHFSDCNGEAHLGQGSGNHLQSRKIYGHQWTYACFWTVGETQIPGDNPLM